MRHKYSLPVGRFLARNLGTCREKSEEFLALLPRRDLLAAMAAGNFEAFLGRRQRLFAATAQLETKESRFIDFTFGHDDAPPRVGNIGRTALNPNRRVGCNPVSIA